jgi:hypothetical protein
VGSIRPLRDSRRGGIGTILSFSYKNSSGSILVFGSPIPIRKLHIHREPIILLERNGEIGGRYGRYAVTPSTVVTGCTERNINTQLDTLAVIAEVLRARIIETGSPVDTSNYLVQPCHYFVLQDLETWLGIQPRSP